MEVRIKQKHEDTHTQRVPHNVWNSLLIDDEVHTLRQEKNSLRVSSLFQECPAYKVTQN